MEKIKWNNRIYALYKGEILLADGTIPEISKQTNKSIDFLRWMTYPTYEKRSAGGKKRLVMVSLDDEE